MMGEFFCTPGSWKWDPAVLLQLDLIKCTVTRMEHTPLKKKREVVGVLVHHVPPTVTFLKPYRAVYHGQHGWQAQTSQILKRAAILTSKDQAASVILVVG